MAGCIPRRLAGPLAPLMAAARRALPARGALGLGGARRAQRRDAGAEEQPAASAKPASRRGRPTGVSALLPSCEHGLQPSARHAAQGAVPSPRQSTPERPSWPRSGTQSVICARPAAPWQTPRSGSAPAALVAALLAAASAAWHVAGHPAQQALLDLPGLQALRAPSQLGSQRRGQVLLWSAPQACVCCSAPAPRAQCP